MTDISERSLPPPSSNQMVAVPRDLLRTVRSCVRNELNRCEIQIAAQRKAPRGAHDPLKYIEALEAEATGLNATLDAIDAALSAERPAVETTAPRTFTVAEPLLNRVYNTLANYANEVTYQAPRIGGVAQGCPRGEVPTARNLVWSARWMLRELEREVLKRDAWDWIGKYEPVGPHCDTCRCSAVNGTGDV